MPTPSEEFDDRLQRELEKAAKKYGVDSLVPTGHPRKDVHDYAINELVGMERYVEMMIARVEQFRDLGHVPRAIAASWILDLLDLGEVVRDSGERLILQRRDLRRRLGSLGDPEYREDG